MELEQASEKIVIHCEKKIDKDTVIDQQRLLFQALQYKKPIIIVGSALITLDTAGLQLLINFCKALTALEIPWKWENASTVLQEYAGLFGAETLLQLPKLEKP